MNRTQILDGLSELQIALNNKVKDAEIDIHALVMSLPRACGISKVLNSEAFAEPVDDEELVTVVKKVYSVFGAPGDWGYGTPLGDALRKIYNC